MTCLLSWQRAGFGLMALGFMASRLWGNEASMSAQVALLAVLVVLLGLPHGALDPLVAYQAHLWHRVRGLCLFLLGYTALAALTLGVWIAFPAAALTGFLILAAWHFSGDWSDDLPRVLRLSAGCWIITSPALFHPEETTRYFSILAHPPGAEWLVSMGMWIALPALAGMAVAMTRSLRTSIAVFAELALLVVSSAVLPPLLFFLVYFCGLHSPRHLMEAAQGLPTGRVILTAGVFTALTVVGAGCAFLLLPSGPVDSRLLQIVFIGLAAVTVPHMALIETWNPSP